MSHHHLIAGYYSAQLTMRAMLLRECKPVKIICSPALRAVQTASAMAAIIGARICVEPGLHEPSVWYSTNGTVKLPFYDEKKLLKAGYPISAEYEPIVRPTYFEYAENELEGRQRIDQVLRSLSVLETSGPILIVGHAISLHTIFLISKQAPQITDDSQYNDMDVTSLEEMWNEEQQGNVDRREIGLRYPPGAVLSVAREALGPPAIFKLITGIVPPLTYGRDFSCDFFSGTKHSLQE